MTKIIEQESFDIVLSNYGNDLHISQGNLDFGEDCISIDKQGAAELIKALQEFLDEN